mgnify:CR=1 FL=1
MKKSLFIAGTIFFVLSVVAFSFGTYILYVATHAESAGDAIAAVVLIPLAVIAYSVQAALCVGARYYAAVPAGGHAPPCRADRHAADACG